MIIGNKGKKARTGDDKEEIEEEEAGERGMVKEKGD